MYSFFELSISCEVFDELSSTRAQKMFFVIVFKAWALFVSVFKLFISLVWYEIHWKAWALLV